MAMSSAALFLYVGFGFLGGSTGGLAALFDL